MTAKLRIGWIGFHQEGHSALQALLDGGAPVAAVLTLAAPQRAARSGAMSYEELCASHGVPLHEIRHVNDPESVQLLRALDLDVVFVIGWSQIIGPEALRTPRLGMIGAHAAMLPHNRGSAPINWAILRGETETGNTLMWLNENVDAGEIIDQLSFPITPYDTCATLYEKVAESNRKMIARLLPKLIAGERPSRPQPPSDEPLLPRRRPKDGLIDWSADGRRVYDFIRGLTRPYPGAFGFVDSARYVIWEAALLPGDPYPTAKPGESLGPMIAPLPNCLCGQVVACGQGAIVALEVELPDGTAIRGRQLAELDWQGKVWTHE